MVDDPDEKVPRHIRRREDRLDARRGQRGGGVDAQHICPGVVGEPQGPVEHAGYPQVVHIVAVTEGLVQAVVLDSPGTDAAGGFRDDSLAAGQDLHRIENFGVPGAPAEMPTQVSAGIVPRETGPLLVKERF